MKKQCFCLCSLFCLSLVTLFHWMCNRLWVSFRNIVRRQSSVVVLFTVCFLILKTENICHKELSFDRDFDVFICPTCMAVCAVLQTMLLLSVGETVGRSHHDSDRGQAIYRHRLLGRSIYTNIYVKCSCMPCVWLVSQSDSGQDEQVIHTSGIALGLPSLLPIDRNEREDNHCCTTTAGAQTSEIVIRAKSASTRIHFATSAVIWRYTASLI